MNRLLGAIRVLLFGALILSVMVPASISVVAAQSDNDVDPTAYESELSGWEIEIVDDDFEIYGAEVQTYRHGQGEIVEIASNTAYIQVSFFDDTDTNADTMEIYNDAFSSDVDEFEVLDAEESGETVYTFALASYNGVEFYYYLSVTEDVEDNVDLLQRIYATDATFFADVEQAQDAITIERDGFLEDVDVDDLEDSAGGRLDEPDEPTEEPTDEPIEEPTTAPDVEAVPTIDADDASSYDFTVIDAQLLATDEVRLGQGEAEVPGFEFLPMGFGESDVIIRLDMRPESPEASLDMMLSLLSPDGGSLENIGTDATRTEAWSLDVLESEGEEYLLYIHVQSDRFQGFHLTELLITPVADVVGTIEDIQRSIQIDGVPMFSGAELETIDFLLSGGNEPDDVDEEEVEDDKADTRDNSDDTGALDLESQGLVSETEFESPQYDVLVEWDDEFWFADQEWDLTAVSDEDAGVDSVILLMANGDASLMVTLTESRGYEPEEYVELWQSDDYVVESIHEDGEVLLADSSSRSGGVVYLIYDAEGNEMVFSQEAIYVNDDVLAIVTIFASPEEFADAYADAEDGVTVDGTDAADSFTPREIERALD